MTHVYQWFSAPTQLHVVCPRCGGRAEVERHDTRTYDQAMAGRLACTRCHHHVEHFEVDWPAHAYYRCSVRGHELWAFSEAHARAIRDHVASTNRSTRNPLILHVPTFFMQAKQREAVVAALDRLLE
jgi:hypothetical protein